MVDLNSFPFKILGISHIGLAPKQPDILAAFLRNNLGLNFEGSEVVTSQKTKTLFYTSFSDSTPNSPRLEILEDATSQEDKDQGRFGPISTFLDKRGSGIHHIALKVDNIEKALVFLKSKNVPLLSETPQVGAHQSLVCFIHPRAAGGVLIELVQEK